MPTDTPTDKALGRAREVYGEMDHHSCHDCNGANEAIEFLAGVLEAYAAEAVAAEREACAKACEALHESMAADYAAAIRARGGEETVDPAVVRLQVIAKELEAIQPFGEPLFPTEEEEP